MPRMEAAAGKQPFRIFFDVVSDELVDAGSESDNFGCNVVNENRTVYSGLVEMFEKGLRRVAEFDDLDVVRPLLLHQVQRLRLKHFEGLDMDVAVGDQIGRWSLAVRRLTLIMSCRQHCTFGEYADHFPPVLRRERGRGQRLRCSGSQIAYSFSQGFVHDVAVEQARRALDQHGSGIHRSERYVCISNMT